MNISCNYFELFQLEPVFDIDLSVLAERFRAVQSEVHPDRHAAGTEQEQLLAMQYSTRANDAYQCLKSPLRRAEYLLELVDEGRDFSNYTLSDGLFLTQQMELREALGESRDIVNIGELREQVSHMLAAEQAKFVSTYLQQQYDTSRDCVSRMHFMHKILSEVAQRLEELEEELGDD
ncbi:MAG: Fe-S protein assembly co-chaperone HscB [Pseudomonadales bacterium]